MDDGQLKALKIYKSAVMPCIKGGYDKLAERTEIVIVSVIAECEILSSDHWRGRGRWATKGPLLQIATVRIDAPQVALSRPIKAPSRLICRDCSFLNMVSELKWTERFHAMQHPKENSMLIYRTVAMSMLCCGVILALSNNRGHICETIFPAFRFPYGMVHT